MVSICLVPDSLRLRLHTSHCAEHGDRSIEHAEGALDLCGKVDMARRIDDVDLVVAPKGGRRCALDGDTPLLFLIHPVHRRLAVVDFADFVCLARII